MGAPAVPRGVVHRADGVTVARTLADESVDLVAGEPGAEFREAGRALPANGTLA